MTESSEKRVFDLAIVGGGPAGLACAINATSEGLSTILIDSKERLGGQASASSLVENYPGFPDGVSGRQLTELFAQQATKFRQRTTFLRPVVARGVSSSAETGVLTLTTDDEELRRFDARAVVLALGLSYRKLNAPGVADYVGRGVSYGLPSPSELQDPVDRLVCVIGGSNSAAQAVMHLASLGCRVRMLVRGPALETSDYLASRISSQPGVKVMLSTEVSEVTGDARLRVVHLKGPEGGAVNADNLCVFIGASPKTYWLNGVVDQTEKGYLLTNHLPRAQPFETSIPGVFAVGDVREGSIKRIASAVGEGSVVVQEVLAHLRHAAVSGK